MHGRPCGLTVRVGRGRARYQCQIWEDPVLLQVGALAIEPWRSVDHVATRP
jgi:hypothetical protein